MQEMPRILGVDDSLTIRRALEIVLKPAGYELELAADGAEALAKAKALKPSLILLDFILPDMRGTEVCHALAADPDTAHIPVVLISAKGAEIRQAYRDASNVVSYIAKPFKPQVVTSIVAEVLAKSAAGELIRDAVPVHEGESVVTPPSPVETLLGRPSPAASLPKAGTFEKVPSPVEHLPVDLERACGTDGDALEDVEEGEAAAEEPVPPISTDAALSDATRRALLEMMFENLRLGLEGVYVEELDTAGAAVDRTRSYTDLLDSLARDLDQSLSHAHSGARYAMYGDGSVRSLDESLLNIFRRSCRLLFRAVAAGAIANEATANRRRILVACRRDSLASRQLRSMLAAHPDWLVFIVSEGFRQLPMMTRLYGPTHLVAEITWNGALWDQLRVLQQLPEAHAMAVLGFTTADCGPGSGTDAEVKALAERGITRVITSAFDLEWELSDRGEQQSSSATGVPIQSGFQTAM